MDRVSIFDTTLRDGEQSPGFSMNAAEKVMFARQLEQLGVDIIEAGFPIASAGDLEGVRAVAAAVRRCKVAALARAKQADVEAGLRALQPAARPRLHIFLATSDLHIEHKLRSTRAGVVKAVSEMIAFARRHVDEVEFSAEDASRSDIEFLCEVCAAAVAAGASILNLPDTVGYALPEEYAAMFARVRESLGDRAAGVTFSAHCHNDLGLAVANSLAAVRAGARQVECTVNGIGERAGNASLEEFVVALAVRRASVQLQTQLDLQKIYATSRLLSSITGVKVAPNKAVVGANAFAHEAGIHQDGILKNPLTYEIISPEAVGIPARRLVLGKHSGRNAVRERVRELGFQVNDSQLGECYRMLMDLADKQKNISDRDVLAAVHQSMRHPVSAPVGARAGVAGSD